MRMAAQEANFNDLKEKSNNGRLHISDLLIGSIKRALYHALLYKEYRAYDYAKGSDISEQCHMYKLHEGDILVQWMSKKNMKVGAFFARLDTNPELLGINLTGRRIRVFRVTAKEGALFNVSTVAPCIDYWTVKGEEYFSPGGGIQYFCNPGDLKMLTKDDPFFCTEDYWGTIEEKEIFKQMMEEDWVSTRIK